MKGKMMTIAILFMFFLSQFKSASSFVPPRNNILEVLALYGKVSGTIYRKYDLFLMASSPRKGDDFSNIKLDKKQKQTRRKPLTRRPPAYWKDMNNISKELKLFWSSINVTIDANSPPPIPSETLLNHFERHDLRYAISNMGGREAVSKDLNAKLIPGKWSEAIKSSDEVKQLLSKSNPFGKGLSKAAPPISRHAKKALVKNQLRKVQKRMHDMITDSFLSANETNASSIDNGSFMMADISDLITPVKEKFDDMALDKLRYSGGERWAQQKDRKARGYWDIDVLIEELYDYQSYIKEKKKRPSIWMARPSEISEEGRHDLRQAIARFGGTDFVCNITGLVPYQEWRYFETQLELFLELRSYLKKFGGEAESDAHAVIFPRLKDIKINGRERLYDLIMDFGGRKMIAIKLDMPYQKSVKDEVFKGLSMGKIDLDFAIRLMIYMRKKMFKANCKNCRSRGACDHIYMPSVDDLKHDKEFRLATEVEKYGFENVARRLQFEMKSNDLAKSTLCLPTEK